MDLSTEAFIHIKRVIRIVVLCWKAIVKSKAWFRSASGIKSHKSSYPGQLN